MLTGLVEPKLKTGKSWLPPGLEVIAAVSTTLPVNPARGPTVTVDVFDVVAPGATFTVVPAIVKPGLTAVVTVT
jgi:hypothetical protein